MSSRPSAPASNCERERGDVLAEVALAEAAEGRGDGLDLADQVAGGVDQVTAHLHQDQAGHRRRGRAGRRTRRGEGPGCRGGRAGGGSGGRSCRASISARRARYQGRNRQFSWIIRRTPARVAARRSWPAGRGGRSAAGFWQSTCAPCLAASATSSAVRLGAGADLDEVEAGVVEHRPRRRRNGLAPGYSAAARSSRSGSRSQSATITAPGDVLPRLQVDTARRTRSRSGRPGAGRWSCRGSLPGEVRVTGLSIARVRSDGVD